MSSRGDSTLHFNKQQQHFESSLKSASVLHLLRRPISATLQVTRRCNLHCIYCSEDAMIKEPTSEFLHFLIDRLQGMDRVIVSGGEPALRQDLPELADHLAKNVRIVAMASNSVLVSEDLAYKLKGSISYVDVTIDGTRETHNRIRGEYDRVLAGIRNFVSAGVDVSLVTVVLHDNVSDILHVCGLADSLKAKKLKILTPINKGRGEKVVSRGLSSPELASLYEFIKGEKEKAGWKVRITITDWDLVNEGHAILIHPDGDVVASPVPSNAGCITKVGNLRDDDLESIWRKYPYKANHIRKYFEESLHVC